MYITIKKDTFKALNTLILNDQSSVKSKQTRRGERKRELFAPAGLHYCEMKIQAGAPPLEIVGRLAE